jgi:hypothetical protein
MQNWLKPSVGKHKKNFDLIYICHLGVIFLPPIIADMFLLK